MKTKVCTACSIEKPLHVFGKKPPSQQPKHSSESLNAMCKPCRSIKSVAWAAANRKKINAKHKVFRQTRYAWINSLKTSPCLDCKTVYPPYVMDFDHLPQFKKSFEISEALAKKYSKARILEEIKKCELVCSNCHRIRGYTRKMEGLKNSAMVNHEK